MSEFSTISSSLAQGAYRSSQELTSQSQPMADIAQETDKPTFSEVLQEAAATAITEAREADGVAQSGLRGEISTHQVVEATMELETTVKMAVSMRDKFVAAYQEVLRMPI